MIGNPTSEKLATLLRPSCNDCSRAAYCLPHVLSPAAMARLKGIMVHSRTVKRGEHIFNAGDETRSIFIVRTGAIKTYAINNHDEITLNIYLPTDILGLDAIVDDFHMYSAAAAAETTSYCSVSHKKLTKLCAENNEINYEVSRLISLELKRETASRMLVLAHRSSITRIAAFLLRLANRYRQIGYPWREFYLPFTRGELGNHLSLTVETTSRLLHELQSEDLIQVKGRYIRLLDLDGLTGLTGNNPDAWSLSGYDGWSPEQRVAN